MGYTILKRGHTCILPDPQVEALRRGAWVRCDCGQTWEYQGSFFFVDRWYRV